MFRRDELIFSRFIFLGVILFASLMFSSPSFAWDGCMGRADLNTPGAACGYMHMTFNGGSGPNYTCIDTDSGYVQDITCSGGPACSGGQTINSTGFCSCPYGTSMQNGSCQTTPCPAGQERPGGSGECQWISSCPQGQTLLTTASAGGSTTSATCAPNTTPPANNQPCVTYADLQTSECQSAKNNCEASGGTFGSVSGGSAGSHNVCIPSGGGNQLPTCAGSAVTYSLNSDGSKTPNCVSLGTGLNNPPPTSSTDPQGTANANIGNGIANTNQILQGGLQAVVNAINSQSKAGGGSGSGSGSEPCSGDNCKNSETKHSASGGDNCDTPPTCDGDQIMCTALKVSWQSKCAAKNEDKQSGKDALGEGGVTEGDKPGWSSVDVGSELTGIFNQSGQNASCPSLPPIHVLGKVLQPSLSFFCSFAENLRPLVLFIFSYLAFRIFVAPRSA